MRRSFLLGLALLCLAVLATGVQAQTSPGLTFNPTSLTVPEGGSRTFTVVLDTQPTGAAVVGVMSSNPDVTVDTTVRAFTTSNWNQPQTITVRAAQDTDDTDDSATLTLTAGQGGYDGVSGTVQVTVDDDEDAAPILVSNLGQTQSSIPGNLASDRAQGFTTGGDSAGYILTSVDFPFRVLSHAAIFSSGLTAEIQTASGSVLATLTNPAYEATTSERTYRFTAPGQGVSLAASTTYYFVLDVHQDIPTAAAEYRGTASDDEDATGQSDWTIEDNSLFRSRTATDNASFIASTNSLRIRLNGAEVTANAVGSYTVPHDWALKPSGLNPGDEFRLLIITADQTAATATNIATYDAFVQASAAGRHVGGAHDAIKPYSTLFKVVGSTASVDARDHIGASPFNASHKDVPI